MIDITGPFYNGHYLVVLIDYYSRFPEILDTKNITSGNIIIWLKEIWGRNGNPDAMVSDNGTQFVSKEFTRFLDGKDIHHYTTSVYNPQENGLVESFNRYLKYGVQAMGKKAWSEGLSALLNA
ncbi:MAG: transposase family protein [Gammaproteobacteria bacterium]|nr:transposase family protein [Gammaproteobacteria bacterium]